MDPSQTVPAAKPSSPDYSSGQWVGRSWEDTEPGKRVELGITVNIEKRNPRLAQIQGFLLGNLNWRTIAHAFLEDTGDAIVTQSPEISVFDVGTGSLVPLPDFLRAQKINRPLPQKTIHALTSRGKHIEGRWENDLGQKGGFSMLNTVHDPPTPPDCQKSWDEFKHYVAKECIGKETLFFRGQPDNTYKLRTSFHRCGRNNLLSYLLEDVPKLRHAINALGHFHYQNRDPEHLAALLSLAQHHSFPTPLLDWTASPYIAAYFAFTDPVPRTRPPEFVRIFVFDTHRWLSIPSANLLHDPMPNLTFLRCEAYNNPRFVPQQSVASLSNRDDIEAHIRAIEETTNQHHLTTIDIPSAEKATVLRDLRYMGITHASMFPGIDGICRTLKERDFG